MEPIMKFNLPPSTALALVILSSACGVEESEPTYASHDPSLVAETIVGDWFYCADMDCMTFSDEAYRFTPEGEIYRLDALGEGPWARYVVAGNAGRFVELSPGEVELTRWDARTKERRVWDIQGRYGVDHDGYKVVRRKGYRTGEGSDLWADNTCAVVAEALRARPSCAPELLETLPYFEQARKCNPIAVVCITRNIEALCAGDSSGLDACSEAEDQPGSELDRWFERPTEFIESDRGLGPIVPKELRLVGAWGECKDRDCHTFAGGRVDGFSFGSDGYLYSLTEESGTVVANPTRKERYYVVSDEDGFVIFATEQDTFDEYGNREYSVSLDRYELWTDEETGYDLLSDGRVRHRRIELGQRRPDGADATK